MKSYSGSRAMAFKLYRTSFPLKGLLKCRFLGPLDSVGLEWDLRICISDKFPGDANLASLDTTLGKSLI